ncbi:MAG: lipoate--protein ligase family protein [Firmicutes bacterium]|nr:lipoate--protein ligase family protein [Bacillota bacterium]
MSPVVAETVAVSVAAGESPPAVIIRRQRPYALLGPRDRRLPLLEAGLSVLTSRGLPVFERTGGGSAVVLDEGCVSFGVVRPCRDPAVVRRNYEELTQGVRLALDRLGIDARFGAAPGSFCEGPYDLVVDGRKVAGVAQTLRGGYALVSGMVLVNQDVAAVTELLNRFYAAAGGRADLSPTSVVSLASLLKRPVSADEVEDALRDGFAAVHGLRESPLTDRERRRAGVLLSTRRVA